KNPRRWPRMFEFRAAFRRPLNHQDEAVPPVEITMPDGAVVCSSDQGVDNILSDALGRSVSLQSEPPSLPMLEKYWPDVEDFAHRETVTEQALPAGGFFDGAAVHILTTATLKKLSSAYPQSAFEARRFRPNLIVAPEPEHEGFVENEWVGCTLRIGDQV